jgi:hypothetical protein
MSMRAICQEFPVVRLINPKAFTSTTNGNSIDLQGVVANTINFVPGTWTDGTHTPKLQDSPDNSTWTDVTAANQVGTLAAITSSGSAVVQQVSYIGPQRYVRPVVTVSGATTGLLMSVEAVVKYKKQP